MRTLNRASVAISFLLLALLAGAAPAAAADVPFKVYITELWQLDDGVDPGLGALADYYAKITVNGIDINNNGACDEETSSGIFVPFQLFKNFNAVSDCDGFRTPWVFTFHVPANQPVHVKIQIFDSDLVFDDEADLKPGSGNAIDLDIDPITGQWSGDVVWPQDCSRPGLSLGGNNANVCWQAGFDTDDDGLLDVWETSGVDTDNDGVIDLNLSLMGANPMRPDIFVETDFLQAATHTHRPNQTALSRVVSSFANAPVVNPDGTTGMQLHVDAGSIFGANVVTSIPGTGGAVGNYGDLGGGGSGGGTVIAEAGNEIIGAFDSGQGAATDFDDLKAANFNPLRETIFRYAIYGHQTNARQATNDCTSGVAHSTRREFLVTLGGVDEDNVPCFGTDANGFSVGNPDQSAGTFMHELGHTLSLGHGGQDVINHKPNYLSVMNYSFQRCGVPASPGVLPGGCDYSRVVPPPLNETNLDECVGIAGGLGFGPVDFNMNTLLEGVSQCGLIFSNTTADVNNDGVCVSPGDNKTLETKPDGDDRISEGTINDGPERFCDTAKKTGSDDLQTTGVGFTPTQPNPLNSFEDWNSVKPSLIDDKINWVFTGQEPDAQTLRDARKYTSEMTAPKVTLDESGPATGKPGDLLTYNIKITNTGQGPALSSVLTETSPDGTSQTSDIGIVTVGAEVLRTTAFTVPANACPGDFTGAGASLAFKNFVGDDLTAADTAPLQVLDVSAPAVTLSLSPNVLWTPDHKFVNVTATIAVTDNCDRNPAVTLVSITSNEPAVGFLGQGDIGPDVQGAGLGSDDRVFSLRSERGTGQGNTGRVYTVAYRVTDASGNATTKTAIVTVPTSQ